MNHFNTSTTETELSRFALEISKVISNTCVDYLPSHLCKTQVCILTLCVRLLSLHDSLKSPKNITSVAMIDFQITHGQNHLIRLDFQQNTVWMEKLIK